MTRGMNNSMRKMAMTTLALFGLILGGAGSLGCDRQTLLSSIAAAQKGQPAPDSGVMNKSDVRSFIWHPRR